MNTKVKICGIRNLESAQAAVAAGADFVGFNFIPGEKRYIDPSAAKNIIKEIKTKTKIVGVFQNNEIGDVTTIVDQLDLDYAQLHGNETYSKKVHTKVIKTIHTREELQNSCDIFLMDIEKNTPLFNFNIFPFMIAGGLNSQNVRGAIKKYKPFAVDVARGIETERISDIYKIKEFVRQAKGVTV